MLLLEWDWREPHSIKRMQGKYQMGNYHIVLSAAVYLVQQASGCPKPTSSVFDSI